MANFKGYFPFIFTRIEVFIYKQIHKQNNVFKTVFHRQAITVSLLYFVLPELFLDRSRIPGPEAAVYLSRN